MSIHRGPQRPSNEESGEGSSLVGPLAILLLVAILAWGLYETGYIEWISSTGEEDPVTEPATEKTLITSPDQLLLSSDETKAYIRAEE